MIYDTNDDHKLFKLQITDLKRKHRSAVLDLSSTSWEPTEYQAAKKAQWAENSYLTINSVASSNNYDGKVDIVNQLKVCSISCMPLLVITSTDACPKKNFGVLFICLSLTNRRLYCWCITVKTQSALIYLKCGKVSTNDLLFPFRVRVSISCATNIWVQIQYAK